MPPVADDNELETESSTVSAEDDKGKKPVDAESSTAQGDNDGDSTLSIVRDAVDKKTPEPAAASLAEGDEAGDEAGDQKPKPVDNVNFTDVPFHKHPRMREIVRQLNVEREDATRYRNVQNFLSERGVSAEEAADILHTVALAKTDPRKAWEQVRPWIEKLAHAAGEVLPEDLRKRVTANEIPVEVAKELARARAAVQSAGARESFDQQQAERRQFADHQRSIGQAAEDWEADRRRRDPNFEAKLVPLQKEIAYLHATEGKPKDAEGVKEQLKRAYKSVNDALPAPAAVPAKKVAINPVRGGQVAGTRSEATSTMDVVNDVLAKHGR